MFSICHFCIIVENLDRSIAFYKDVIGMTLGSTADRAEEISKAIAHPGAKMKNAVLYVKDEPRPWLELIQYIEPAGRKIDLSIQNPGTAHISFEVEHIDAACRELRRKGVTLLSDPVRLPPNPKTGAKGGYIAYFTDPDGFSLELYQRLG